MFCKFSKMTLEERRARKLKMYNFFEESLEERLAGIKAAKAKLEEQMAKSEYCAIISKFVRGTSISPPDDTMGLSISSICIPNCDSPLR